MFTHILVPLDGSRLAESALSHVVALTQVFDASVTLLHALTKETDGQRAPTDPLDWRLQRAEAETYLAGWTVRLRELGVRAHSEVVEGKAADTIVDVAHEWGVDLIVIGSHGRSGLSKWTISSVAQKVVMRAQTSLLLVRTYCTNEPLSMAQLKAHHYHKILMPLDGSKRAEYAIGAIRPFLKQVEVVGLRGGRTVIDDGNGERIKAAITSVYGALEHSVTGSQPSSRCLVAHVVCRPALSRQTQPTHEELDAVERVVEYNRQTAVDYLERLSEHTEYRIEQHLLVGNNATAPLQRLAEEEAVDLVVLCAHGSGGDPRWSYGSVTTSFVCYSDAPLLIVQDVRDINVDATAAAGSAQQKKGH